jgi:hypothetical protein
LGLLKPIYWINLTFYQPEIIAEILTSSFPLGVPQRLPEADTENGQKPGIAGGTSVVATARQPPHPLKTAYAHQLSILAVRTAIITL